jgi:hypothetical protein
VVIYVFAWPGIHAKHIRELFLSLSNRVHVIMYAVEVSYYEAGSEGQAARYGVPG